MTQEEKTTYHLHDLFKEKYGANINNQFTCYKVKNTVTIDREVIKKVTDKKRVNILALGDVGSTLLMGLKLLGKECISEIGIFDIDPAVCKRYEMELNQIKWPFDEEKDKLPKVKILSEEELFNCDVFVFCASKGVPPVENTQDSKEVDVRMVQYEANKTLVELYTQKAIESEFKGIFAVVSDPVDPLCMAVVRAGLSKHQVRGFGLGVMNARASYFAEKDEKFKSFLEKGRVFGPHGSDLVVCNDIYDYDDDLSKELTNLTVTSNLKTRELGFKPYIAPALSSGAMSIISMLNNKWHYSSVCFGDAFLGVKNKYVELISSNMTSNGLKIKEITAVDIEDLPLDEKLFERIKLALYNLENIK